VDPANLWLALVALGAAIINGAIGYGFSTIITPIGVLWFSNKVLNPALVSVELVVNITLLYRERAFISVTKARAMPVVKTLLPGVLLGTVGLTYLAVNDVKVVVYLVLLPIVVIQLLGLRRPFSNERQTGAVIGPGIGFLYALTTISGPPLAVFFRNQGLSKNEFRCTMSQVRVAESSLTLATYLAFTELFGANLVSAPSIGLIPYLLIPVIVGVPIGTWIMTRVSRDMFTRAVMAMDGTVVSFGLSQVIIKLKWVGTTAGDEIFGALVAVVAALSAYSLYRRPGAQKLVDRLRTGEGPTGTRPPASLPSTTTSPASPSVAGGSPAPPLAGGPASPVDPD
jgi:uncharacterized membrane protein YfcA